MMPTNQVGRRMPGAGTDRTKDWVAGGPIVILVEPQLGENIGAVARVMGNFGLSELRLVKPRDGWPNIQAQRSASGADRILDEAKLFNTLDDAIADCNYVIAATARQHDQAKEVIGAEESARRTFSRISTGESVALVFGRERNGLENDEVGLADAILTLPVNPAFASLNLGQAVAVTSYEYFKLTTSNQLPFVMPEKSQSAPKEQLLAFFETLERELDKVEFFRPPEKHGTMRINLRNIVTRMNPTQQDIQTLHGIIMAIADGRKGSARGGVMDGEEAKILRVLIAERGSDWITAFGRGATRLAEEHATVPSLQGPARGLAKLLRRNPTTAERLLWDGLTKDRRFAASSFKRQVPVGPHIPDIVSFPLRTVIDIAATDEPEEAANSRHKKLDWLRQRRYRIISVLAAEIESNLPAFLDRLDAEIAHT